MTKREQSLFDVIRDDNNKLYDKMIKEIDDISKIKDDRDFDLLLIAAYSSNLYVVKDLIKRKVNINSIIKDGDNALHFAAYNNKPKIAEVLIKAGIDINHKGYEDRVPITLAITEDSWEAFEVIYKAKPDMEIDNDVNRHSLDYIRLKPLKDKKKYEKIMKRTKVGKYADLLR